MVILFGIGTQNDGGQIAKRPRLTAWKDNKDISAETTASYINAAYDLGAAEYVNRPFDPKTIRRHVSNTIMLYFKQKFFENAVTEQVLEKELKLPWTVFGLFYRKNHLMRKERDEIRYLSIRQNIRNPET